MAWANYHTRRRLAKRLVPVIDSLEKRLVLTSPIQTAVVRSASPAIVYDLPVSLIPSNLPSFHLRHRDFALYADPFENVDLYRQDATFVPRPGLADPSLVSFESVNYPGRFLRHRDYELFLDPNDGSDLFRQDATFRAGTAFGDGGVTLESFNLPGWFIRHQNLRLRVAPNDGSELFHQDATFRAAPGLIPRPAALEIGDSVILSTRTNYIFNSHASTGPVSAIPVANFDPVVSDEIFSLLEVDGDGILQDGDRVMFRTRTGAFFNSHASQGPVSAIPVANFDPAVSDEIFVMHKLAGGADTTIRSTDLVYITTRYGFYFNSHASQGAVSAIAAANFNPAESDELFRLARFSEPPSPAIVPPPPVANPNPEQNPSPSQDPPVFDGNPPPTLPAKGEPQDVDETGNSVNQNPFKLDRSKLSGVVYKAEISKPTDIDFFEIDLNQGEQLFVEVNDFWKKAEPGNPQTERGLKSAAYIFRPGEDRQGKPTQAKLGGGGHQDDSHPLMVTTGQKINISQKYYIGISASGNDRYNIFTGRGPTSFRGRARTGRYEVTFRIEPASNPTPSPTPSEFSVRDIPSIMRRLGWNNAAKLLDKWFDGRAATAPNYTNPPAQIDMSFVNGDADGHDLIEELISEFEGAARAPKAADEILLRNALVSRARRLLASASTNVASLTDFSLVSVEGNGRLRANQQFHETQKVASAVSATIPREFKPDDLYGALGRFSVYAAPIGTVARSGRTAKVTITGVAMYVRDSFDFEGSQPGGFGLGNWRLPDGFSVTRKTGYTFVDNPNLREYRSSTGFGGDFLVFSDFLFHTFATPLVFSTSIQN